MARDFGRVRARCGRKNAWEIDLGRGITLRFLCSARGVRFESGTMARAVLDAIRVRIARGTPPPLAVDELAPASSERDRVSTRVPPLAGDADHRPGERMSRRLVISILTALIVCLQSAHPTSAVELAPGDILVGLCSGSRDRVGLIRVDPLTGAQEQLLPGLYIDGVAIDPDGSVVVSTSDNDRILRFDPASETFEVVSEGGVLHYPGGLSLAENGLIYTIQTPQTPTHQSILVGTDPETGDNWIVSEGGLLQRSKDTAVDTNGDILVAQGDPRTRPTAGLIRVDPETGSQSAFSIGSPPYFTTFGVAVGPDGRIVVADPEAPDDKVLEVDRATGEVTPIPVDGLIDPVDIAFAPDGDLVIVDGSFLWGGQVLRVDSGTGQTTVVSSGGFFLGSQCMHRLAIVPPPRVLEVGIDIQPHQERNSVPGKHGIVRVAILGSPEFDVRDVDRTTITFGPGGADPIEGKWPIPPALLDVNRDGLLDLVSRFRVEEAGLEPGESEACLMGKVVDGRTFEGCDGVRVVPTCGLGFELVVLLPVLGFRLRLRGTAKRP